MTIMMVLPNSDYYNFAEIMVTISPVLAEIFGIRNANFCYLVQNGVDFAIVISGVICGDTTTPSGLYSALCHAFLVLFSPLSKLADRAIYFSLLRMVDMFTDVGEI